MGVDIVHYEYFIQNRLDKIGELAYKRVTRGPIAQLVEQAIENRCVAGSNPARATITKAPFWGLL
jgi:hypothetical protein